MALADIDAYFPINRQLFRGVVVVRGHRYSIFMCELSKLSHLPERKVLFIPVIRNSASISLPR